MTVLVTANTSIAPWEAGVRVLNRLITFKRGDAVVTHYDSFRDTKVWSNRIKAFEVALVGMSDAKLPASRLYRLFGSEGRWEG